MNVFNVHSNRLTGGRQSSEALGTIPGVSSTPLSTRLPKKTSATPCGCEPREAPTSTCVQVAGLIARRILCYAAEGDRLARGQRFGFIRFGSRVDIYVPEDSSLVAALGDKVYASSTVIATLANHA